jgi:hypothetical protein
LKRRPRNCPRGDLRSIYYRLYSWNLKIWGLGDLPQYNVCLWLAVVSVANVFSLALIFRVNLGVHSRYVALCLFLLSALAHYLYFVHNDRYKTLAAEFSEQSSPVTTWLLPSLYAVGGPAVFVVLVALLGPVAA